MWVTSCPVVPNVRPTRLLCGSCVTCPAHLTKFDLTTGQPVGEWCPKVGAEAGLWHVGASWCVEDLLISRPAWLTEMHAACGSHMWLALGAFYGCFRANPFLVLPLPLLSCRCPTCPW